MRGLFACAVLTASSAAVAVLPAPAAWAAPVDSCTVRSVATAKWTSSHGHAVHGQWRLHPALSCNHAKIDMSIRAVLKHRGVKQLSSSASCTANETKLCKKVVAPRKVKRYGQSIRGTWNIAVRFTFSGADAQSIAQSNGGRCHYRASTLTAICAYVDGPYHIK